MLTYFGHTVLAQESGNERSSELELTPPDTLGNPEVRLDTLLPVLPDSILLITAADLDSTQNQPKGDIQTTINYYAEDSIITDFAQNKVFLYKGAWFEYGNIRLDADYIAIDWKKN